MTLANILLSLIFPLFGIPAASHTDGLVLSALPNAPVPAITAEKAAVLAGAGRLFLFTQEAEAVQPIASLTKLMTALVFLDNNPGWENIYEVTAADQVAGGRLNLFRGDRVTLRDLFHTSLVASDNGATLALARATGLDEAQFVRRMNDKANSLGLSQTHFAEPVGLSQDNVSTAREVALLAQAALARPEIREATAQKEYRFTTESGRDKLIESTDYLLFSELPSGAEIRGGKTGYTERAGYCFAGLWRDADGREIITAVLNSPGINDRFRDSRGLANWAFSGYNWNK